MRVHAHKVYAHEALNITNLPSSLVFTIGVRLIVSGLLSFTGAFGATAAIYAISNYQGATSVSDAAMAGITVFSLTFCLTLFSETWGKAIQSTTLITTLVLFISGALSFFL